MKKEAVERFFLVPEEDFKDIAQKHQNSYSFLDNLDSKFHKKAEKVLQQLESGGVSWSEFAIVESGVPEISHPFDIDKYVRFAVQTKDKVVPFMFFHFVDLCKRLQVPLSLFSKRAQRLIAKHGKKKVKVLKKRPSVGRPVSPSVIQELT